MEVAGANRRWRCQFRYRGSRRESAVAQLFSLGVFTFMKNRTLTALLMAAAIVASGCSKRSQSVTVSPGDSIFQIRLVLDEPVTGDYDDMPLIRKVGDTLKFEKLHVQRLVLLDQTALKSATLTTNDYDGGPCIMLTFTDEGAKKLAEVTRQNTDKLLAFIIDGRIYTAVRIMEEISG